MAVYQHHLLIFLYFLTHLLLIIPTNSHNTNITVILDAFPDYSLYNTYLSKTNLCHQINSHNTVTCLVLSNSAMSSLVAHQSLTRIKNALRHLILLGYFDQKILHNLTRGGGTTLTGNTSDNHLGFVNITNLHGGRVGFSSARPGLAFDAMYVKSVKQVPYNLSVLEISAPITFPGLMDFNLTALLEKAGCKIFASLITASGVLKIYESTMDKGFTLFAPKDIAFKADGAPDLTNLSRTDLVTILQYHAMPSYTTKASLKTAREPIATMASSSSGKYNLNLSVICHGDEVFLSTGVSTAQVASTVLDDTPTMSVLTVESLLLPSEMLISVPVPTAPSQVALTPTPIPSTAPPPRALPEPDARRPNRRPPHPRPPPRPRPPPAPHARVPPPPHAHSPPAPHARVPPPPHAHSPPAPHADVPPPPSFPDIVLPPDHAPSPDHNGAAGRLIANCLASLVIASVCITTVFL